MNSTNNLALDAYERNSYLQPEDHPKDDLIKIKEVVFKEVITPGNKQDLRGRSRRLTFVIRRERQ